MDLDDVRTPGGIGVPSTALSWRFTRSSAPGGQHVNTSSTRAELRCDLAAVEASPAVVERIRDRLGDELRVSSQQERSQLRNRERALARLLAMLDEAAAVDPPRRPTRPSRSSVHRRLEGKKLQSDRKANRRWRPDD
jgi:ribosome-associated protein